MCSPAGPVSVDHSARLILLAWRQTEQGAVVVAFKVRIHCRHEPILRPLAAVHLGQNHGPHQHLVPCFVLALLLLFPCPHPLNFGIDSRSLFFELGQPIRRLVAPLNHLDTPLLMCCLVGYHGGTAAAIPTLLCRGGRKFRFLFGLFPRRKNSLEKHYLLMLATWVL